MSPIRFGNMTDRSRATFRIKGDPDLQTGDVLKRATLDVHVDATPGRSSQVARSFDPALPTLVISYRRDDSGGHAGRLHADLVQSLLEWNVCQDLDCVPGGEDFQALILDRIRRSAVVLVVIGKRWLRIEDETGRRRLSDPEDLVRLEVASALRTGATVIPVLVGGASMPKRDELPAELHSLVKLNACELSDARWQHDLNRLVQLAKPK